MRESLRQAVEHGVLVADQATGSFRFRHALLAEAIYATILPGEREELHARLADELARSAAAAPAELAPHWAAAGRTTRRRSSPRSRRHARRRPSSAWRRRSRTSSGRSRCGTPCRTRPSSCGLDLAELCSWAAELASQTGAAPRAVELARRAIELVGESDPLRAALLHETPRPLPARERQGRRRPRRVRARGRARAGAAALAGARAGAGGARGRVDAGAGASTSRCRSASRRSRSRVRSAHTRGGAPGAHDARQRPRLPRPRRRGRSRSSGWPLQLAERARGPRRLCSARTSRSPTC